MATIIEQIRAKIERRIKSLNKQAEAYIDADCETMIDEIRIKIEELRLILSFLDTLQEPSCDTCTNDKGCVTCKDGELWEGKEVGLEKKDNDCPCCGNALDGAGCCSCCGYGRR